MDKFVDVHLISYLYNEYSIEMVTKNVIANLTNGEKFDGANYDIWYRKIQYLLNEQEWLDHHIVTMDPLKEGNSAQHYKDQEAYRV